MPEVYVHEEDEAVDSETDTDGMEDDPELTGWVAKAGKMEKIRSRISSTTLTLCSSEDGDALQDDLPGGKGSITEGTRAKVKESRRPGPSCVSVVRRGTTMMITIRQFVRNRPTSRKEVEKAAKANQRSKPGRIPLVQLDKN